MTRDKEHQTPRSDWHYDWADKLERQVDDPTNSDDPKWLKRHASKVRSRGLKKEKALEHKVSQRLK